MRSLEELEQQVRSFYKEYLEFVEFVKSQHTDTINTVIENSQNFNLNLDRLRSEVKYFNQEAYETNYKIKDINDRLKDAIITKRYSLKNNTEGGSATLNIVTKNGSMVSAVIQQGGNNIFIDLDREELAGIHKQLSHYFECPRCQE